MLQVREEEAEGAEDSREGRCEDAPDPEGLRETRGVDAAAPADRDQGEPGRVQPALGRDAREHPHHVRVRDPVHPVRGVGARLPDAFPEVRDGPVGRLRVERKVPPTSVSGLR